MKKFKYILILLTSTFFFNSLAAPGVCGCSPDEFEVPANYPDQPTADAAWAACLASDPNCNEEVPVNENVILLILGGIAYAMYAQKNARLVFQKLKTSIR